MPRADSHSREEFGVKEVKNLDDFGRRHTKLILMLTLAIAAAVTLILLSQTEAPAVLYQIF
jgi:hypothetical protein